MGCQPKAMQLPANDDAFMHKSLPHCSTKALLLKKILMVQRQKRRIDHKKHQRGEGDKRPDHADIFTFYSGRTEN